MCNLASDKKAVMRERFLPICSSTAATEYTLSSTKVLNQSNPCGYIHGHGHGRSKLARKLCKLGHWKCWGVIFSLQFSLPGPEVSINAVRRCLPPWRFPNLNPVPAASPPETGLTPFFHTLQGGTSCMHHPVVERSRKMKKLGFNVFFCPRRPGSRHAPRCLVRRLLVIFSCCNGLLGIK